MHACAYVRACVCVHVYACVSLDRLLLTGSICCCCRRHGGGKKVGHLAIEYPLRYLKLGNWMEQELAQNKKWLFLAEIVENYHDGYCDDKPFQNDFSQVMHLLYQVFSFFSLGFACTKVFFVYSQQWGLCCFFPTPGETQPIVFIDVEFFSKFPALLLLIPDGLVSNYRVNRENALKAWNSTSCFDDDDFPQPQVSLNIFLVSSSSRVILRT